MSEVSCHPAVEQQCSSTAQRIDTQSKQSSKRPFKNPSLTGAACMTVSIGYQTAALCIDVRLSGVATPSASR